MNTNTRKTQQGEIGVGGMIGLGLFAIAILLSLTWAFQGNDFFLTKVFAPKYEQVRRETFEQSKAYNQGVIQELQKQYVEYAAATSPDVKNAIASVVLHQVADYPEDQLPMNLRAFVQKLRADRTGTSIELK